MVTLEEEIERLYRKKSHSGPERRRRDGYESGERSRNRQCEAKLSGQPTASQSADPDMPLGGTESKGGDSDLGDPTELQAEVASFLQGLPETTKEENEGRLPEPPISQPAKWV